MKKPLISVLMPAYNHEAFVAEAIDSVLNQTYDDLELIIVNDGATDGTEAVIKKFDDHRIRYFSQSNKGAHHALNRCLSLAQGEYIAIINSDDVYAQNRLEVLLETIQHDNLSFVITDINLINQDSEIIRDASHWWLKWYTGLKSTYQDSGSPAAAFLAGNYAITSSNFFFQANRIDQIGLFRPFRYILDYDFVYRAVYDKPDEFAFLVGQYLLNYRLHSHNTIQENPWMANAETHYFLKKSIARQFGNTLAAPIHHISNITRHLGKIQINDLKRQHTQLKHELTQQINQRQALTHQNQTLTQERNDLTTRLNLLEHSKSLRIGKTITAPGRWMIGKLQSLHPKRSNTIKDSAQRVSALHAKLITHLPHTKVVSFDIFDTVLERDIDPPDEVKLIVARKLCRTLSDDYNLQYTVDELMRIRNEIEYALRRQCLDNGRDFECKFSDLAARLARHLCAEHAEQLTERIINHELETESEVLSVKKDMAVILSWLNNQNIRVIAISDMYLDQSHLHHIFAQKGLTAHFDHIYVSSESGIGKHSGRLFEYVLTQEGLQPSELLHIGDNRHSDYRSPARMGIHCIHFNDKSSIRRLQTLRAYNRLATKNPYWRGRYLLQIIRPAKSQGFYYDYGYSILGPIYATFILGTIEAIKKNNITHVYFLAREGELFMKLFRLILPDFFEPHQIPETDYLYVSRRSTSPAAAHSGLTYEAAIVPLFNPKQRGWYSICNAFGLPADQFIDIAKKHGYSNIEQPIYDWKSGQFKTMLNDPEFQHRVKQHTHDNHNLLYRYLDQHGFFAQKKVAVVDIGWNGSIQKFLEDAFGNHNNYPHVFGLYMGFIGGIQHCHNHDKNTIVGVLCDERGKPRPQDVFSRFEEIFEEGARALHPTTIGYRKSDDNSQIEPVFQTDAGQDRAAELRANTHIEQFQAGIIDFTSEFARAIDLTGYGFDDIKPFILTLAERAIVFPTPEEIDKLMQLGHAEDFGTGNVMDFRDEKIDSWLALLRPRRLFRTLAMANWKYGTARSLGIPGFNMIIRFYDLMKSK